MQRCTCQEPTDKPNSKAERKSNAAHPWAMPTMHLEQRASARFLLLFSDKQRTRLPENRLILLLSHELLLPELSVRLSLFFFLILVIYLLLFFAAGGVSVPGGVPAWFLGSLAAC